MDFWHLIAKRRSIRQYQPKAVEAEKVDQIMEAALRAPTSQNLQPCEFIAVTAPEVIGELAKARTRTSILSGAPLAMVICVDPEKCDVWIENAAIAATFICLAAEALDLGHCWLQIRERMHSSEQTAEDFVRKVLQIPAQLRVVSIIAIGYPAEEKDGHPREELKFEKIHQDIYGN